MDRRFFLTICAGALVSAAPAFAGSFENAVIKQLKAQGFRQITVETTLLGRVRIVAHSKAGRREIVLNPRTGEILRDVLTAADGSVAPAIAHNSGGSENSDGSNSGSDDGGSDDNGGSDDGGSDDNGGSDDGGSDDNSGSGSDDSGSDDSGSDDSGSDDSGSDDSDSEDSDSEDSGSDASESDDGESDDGKDD